MAGRNLHGVAGVLTQARAAEPWTLERALDYAHARNQDARIAKQRIAVAASRKALALPQLGPQLPAG